MPEISHPSHGQASSRFYPGCTPPKPPLTLTPRIATNPDTDMRVLWYIARHVPALRFWLIANPSATPELLEYVSQVGGPHVKESFDVLFSALDTDESSNSHSTDDSDIADES